MQQITKFVADDGTEFKTEGEALARDAEIATEKSVEAFLAAENFPKAHAGFLRTVLPKFVAFMS